MILNHCIIEEGLSGLSYDRLRNTVRAVILNNQGELLLVYSNYFDDFTFPGGGIKKDEKEVDGLHRELKEELGAIDLEILTYLGEVKEIRYGINQNDTIYLQTSHYYQCHIKQFGKQQLIGREIDHGLEPRWISIEQAIKHNERVINDEKHAQKGLKTVLKREIYVLSKIKEIFNHEKI